MADLSWRSDPSSPVELTGIPSHELIAVGALWKKANRELAVRFGGTSMEPTIAPADEVLLRCDDGAESLRDVIAFVYADQVVVHRIVAQSSPEKWLLTRGDGRTIPDPPLVDRRNVIGRIVAIRREGCWSDLPPHADSPRQRLALRAALAGAIAGPRGIALAVRLLRLIRSLGPGRSRP